MFKPYWDRGLNWKNQYIILDQGDTVSEVGGWLRVVHATCIEEIKLQMQIYLITSGFFSAKTI